VKAKRVVVADDHPMVRSAVTEALKQVLGSSLQVIEAGSLAATQKSLKSGEIDLLLLDLDMPGMNGAVGLSVLRAEFPTVPILVISAIDDPVTVHQVIELGASGFQPKSAPLATIKLAITAVLDGQLWLPADMGAPPVDIDADLATRVAQLTAGQRRVLDLLSEGKLNKEIAFELRVTEAAIKARLSQIFRKLGVRNRTQAVILARHLSTRKSKR